MTTTLELEQRDAASGRPVAAGRATLACRCCAAPLTREFVDLGLSPLCQSIIPPERLGQPEMFYPLKAYVCDECWLAQLPAFVSGEEIFSEYAYFSSFSQSWLDHCRRYARRMINRLGLTAASQVVELASNDGYLLQYFVQQGIPALGVEPAANVAQQAIAKGVPTLIRFFGQATAEEMIAAGPRADLLIGNNVLAHVPDLNDFVAGMRMLLADEGVITMEFPHLMRLVEETQFDTIYHEHFSYFSLLTAREVFARHSLTIFDVEQLPTHGGSLRIYAQRAEAEPDLTPALLDLADLERQQGYDSHEPYERFAASVERVRAELLEFLLTARRDGKLVAGYGAPGKGNTLLNYCGIRTDLLPFTVDRNPYKQGVYTPGARIPIHPVQRIDESRPDYILILPWNLRDEIMDQLSHARDWGAKFVTPIPKLTIHD